MPLEVLKTKTAGKNELWWLADGPGAHGDAAIAPDVVAERLGGCFRFVTEGPSSPGLREPQIGALHAILARRTVAPNEVCTIVMPTGTGKTETMLATFAHDPRPTLVVVPSSALRIQIATKFVSLGVLPGLGAVEGDFLCPSVAVLQSRLGDPAEAEQAAGQANVIVTTVQAFARCSEVAKAWLANYCERMFVDEAHHMAARSWSELAEWFEKKPIVQFTATPFREDGKDIGGRLAYTYPLRLAQERGYFSPIKYRSVSGIGDVDRRIAELAVAQLREDLGADRDHILMARVKTIPRAAEVLSLYEEIASDLGPIRIDSKLSYKRQTEAKAKLDDRSARIVVCVDMLGEGFDLPALKIAAIHDPHKSLAVTLQFVGRFTRAGEEASAFVPKQAGQIDELLRNLYGENADWNVLIRELTEGAVQAEQNEVDFEESFNGMPQEVAARSIQPKMSTVVYRSDSMVWNPTGVYELFAEEELLTKQIAISETEHVVWFITRELTPVRWADVRTFAERVHHLYLVHCDLENNLLYINSSNNDAIHLELAKAVGGEGVEIVRGTAVYRILAGIDRRVPTNVGLLDAVNRNRRFMMLVGADVLEGFGPTGAQKSKTNIFAHGYKDGGRVSFGASLKGRIWSYRAARGILDWVEWARTVGTVITDDGISIAEVMANFILPVFVDERPELVPLGIEWDPATLLITSENREVTYGTSSHPLIDLSLDLTAWERTGPITFDVVSDDWSVSYEMTFGTDGPMVTPTAGDAEIDLPQGAQPLAAFMNTRGLAVYFEQEALLAHNGYMFQPDRERPSFPSDQLEVLDWSNINIRKEAQGRPDRATDSVQYLVAETLMAEHTWEIVINDDAAGETADLVLLRRHERVLHVCLAHSKYSSEDSPGARIGDLYELCGQAQKAHRARSEMDRVLTKLIRRERNRDARGESGMIVGDLDVMHSILDEVHLHKTQMTIVLAQPGLSHAAMSADQAELLACTQLYLSETYGSHMRVFCSD